MTRLVRKHPAFFSVALIILAIPAIVRITASIAATPSPVITTDVASTMIRSGLDAEALAAAGASSSETTTVVADFQAAMASEPTRLSSADDSYRTAKVTSDQLRRTIQSGRGSAEDVTSYQTAMSDLQTAEGGRQSALDDWFDAGVATLSTAQVAALRTIRGNRHWNLDIEFLAVDRDEAEWVAVRDALAAERYAVKYSEPVPAAAQASLSAWRSNAAVASARTCCASNLSSVESAWNTATN